MRDLWTTELTAEETDALISKLAIKIKQRKLEVPAILFLEMHKPLANIAGQAAVVFSPFLIAFVGFDKVNDYSRLLSKRENFERLIRLLEQAETEPSDSKEGNSGGMAKSAETSAGEESVEPAGKIGSKELKSGPDAGEATKPETG
jgi:hypothetical protein